MSDYTPTGDGWIEGVPADDSTPVEIVSYTTATASDTGGVGGAQKVWHRPLPSLPTTPGYYVTFDAGEAVLVELLPGTPARWIDGAVNDLTEEHVRALHALQRLVTAAELLEQVRQAITALGTLDGDAKAAIYTALDGIEDGYGVNG